MPTLNSKREILWREYCSKSETFPVDVVAIETLANCNRACGYCPVSTHAKRKGRLDSDLVFDLLDQLGALRYSKKLTFHYYNEPLLDKRIYDFIAYAAEKLPDAHRLLTTNGDLLDDSSFRKLLDSGASAVANSAHDLSTFQRITRLRDGLPDSLKEKLAIRPYFRVGDGSRVARITNRGGSIDLRAYLADEVIEATEQGCNRVQFNIEANGDVHPCCNDFESNYVLGNIKVSPIATIWQRSVSQYQEHFTGNYQKTVCKKCAKLL